MPRFWEWWRPAWGTVGDEKVSRPGENGWGGGAGGLYAKDRVAGSIVEVGNEGRGDWP